MYDSIKTLFKMVGYPSLFMLIFARIRAPILRGDYLNAIYFQRSHLETVSEKLGYALKDEISGNK